MCDERRPETERALREVALSTRALREAPSALLAAMALVGCAAQTTNLAASSILEPMRLPVVGNTSLAHQELTITTGDGLHLDGWLFTPEGTPKGLVVFLHGRDANRQHFTSDVPRFTSRGYAVLAYDQRGHGRSEGKTSTFGAKEVPDLRVALDQVGITPVFLIGESMGAAVALQAGAADPRVKGVVAGASFSDLRTIIAEHSPFFLSEHTRDDAIALAEQREGFKVDDISPVRAAANLHVPLLLLHGTEDPYISPIHSARIHAAAKGSELVRLEGVGHIDILLHDEAWTVIEAWFDRAAKLAATAG